MVSPFLIETRRISGTGVFILSPHNTRLRRYTLFADIIRKQQTPYFNRRHEPPQTFYGYISLVKDGYFTQTLSLQYDAQKWTFDADISGQNLVAIKCEYLGILQSFANLGSALGLTVISVENTIANYQYLPLPWDRIICKCDSDCAIQLSLFGLEYEACVEQYLDPAGSPIPPLKPTPVPPGTATDISPPYEGDTITQKAEIDKTFTPPPLGAICEVGVLSFTIKFRTTNGELGEAGVRTAVRGLVGTTWRSPSPGVVEIQTQGFASESCRDFAYTNVGSIGGDKTVLDVINLVFPEG